MIDTIGSHLPRYRLAQLADRAQVALHSHRTRFAAEQSRGESTHPIDVLDGAVDQDDRVGDATTSGSIQVDGEINIVVAASPTAWLTSQDAVDLDLSFPIPFEIEECSELDDLLTTTDLLVAEVANAFFQHGLPRRLGNGLDFDPTFLDAYNSGEGAGEGTDMNCDGIVNGLGFDLFLPMFVGGTPPGPSGLACAGTEPCP